MNTDQARELVDDRSRVRVFSLADPAHLMTEGRVIAFTERPTITIEHDDGTRSSWIIDLPVEYEHREWRAVSKR